MANGAKFSQIGADVSRASDHELHFDSDWPTVHVLQGGLITSTVAGAGGIFYRHGLGFTPAFIPYVYDPISREFEIFRVIMGADRTNIYYHAPGGSGGGSAALTYGVFIYNIDIEKNYQAPKLNPNPTPLGGEGEEQGIAIAIEGQDVNSKNMQDFKVNTSARAPLIHAVANSEATLPSYASGVRDFSYTHDLPYNPMFLPYIETQFSGAPHEYILVANFAGTITKGNTIILQGLLAGTHGAIVILKDPFDVSENTTQVSV